MINCHCGNTASFKNCCEPYIKGLKKPETAEVLMRSRYSAFATAAADYLVATTHLSKRNLHNKKDILNWSQSNQWIKLEVLASTETTVIFNAYYLDRQLQAHIHHELSTFVEENGIWYYVDGEF